MTTTASLTGRTRRLVTGVGIVLSAAASFAGLAASPVNAGSAVVGNAPSPAVTDTEVTSAKLGLMLWILGNLSNDDAVTPLQCPILRQDQVGFYMGNAGLAPSSSGYLVDIYFDDQLGGGTGGVTCGPDVDLALDNPDPATPHYLILEALSLDGGSGTFADVIASYENITLTTAPAPGDLGGEIASGCVGSDMALCLEIWHRDGLVIVMGLVGPATDITEPLTQQLIVAMLPEAVAGLGAAGFDDTTVPTVPTVPTVTVAPVPTPPVTVAPVPTSPVTVAPVPTSPVTVPTLPTVPPTVPATVPPVATTIPANLPTVPVATIPQFTLPTVPQIPVLPTVPVPSTAPLSVPATGALTIPPGYVQLVDDTGQLTVVVPATWTNIDTAPDVNDDGSPRPYIEASTNIERMRETFDAPGVLLVTDPFIADTATYVDQMGITSGCRNEVIEPFSNGVLTGHVGHWTACGSGAAEFHFVVASPADQTRTVLIQVQTTGPQEQEALDVALATFGLV